MSRELSDTFESFQVLRFQPIKFAYEDVKGVWNGQSHVADLH